MKSQRVELQTGYVLHLRPYRETSVLLELFTLEQGRISALAKGGRKLNSRWHTALQLFTPVYLSWIAHGELCTLTHAEISGTVPDLMGKRLLCGLYANELLIRLMQREDAHPQIYWAYHQLLIELAHAENEQPALRIFEKRLLQELGYAFSLTHDYQTAHPIEKNAYYQLDPNRGLTQVSSDKPLAISGESILALAHEQLAPAHFKDAKRLMRIAIANLLGGKPLHCYSLLG